MDRILLNIKKSVFPRVALTWSVEQLVAWLKEVEPSADTRGKFDWLEIPPIASSSAIQDAYHQIARTRHPDLFRSRIDIRTLDRLVRMYARVTAAYAELKDPEKCAAYLRELRGPKQPTTPPGTPAKAPPLNKPATTAPPPAARAPIAATDAPPVANTPAPRPPSNPPSHGSLDPAHSMNARALSFYRRAEGILKTGDRSAALLQLKMAIAADPKSSFLRAALAELTRS